MRERWTMYDNQGLNIYDAKRLLDTDTGMILVSYTINATEPEATVQKFINMEKMKDADTGLVQSRKKWQNYNWKQYETNPIIFVQINGSAFLNESEALETRQNLEPLIDKQLKSEGLGEWLAGDLGAGGTNMLFSINRATDVEKAKRLILNLLYDNGFGHQSIIGRRINTSEGDWFYEVLYPINFSGPFLTM